MKKGTKIAIGVGVVALLLLLGNKVFANNNTPNSNTNEGSGNNNNNNNNGNVDNGGCDVGEIPCKNIFGVPTGKCYNPLIFNNSCGISF
jgi:hypothetical protein